jgi:uncharacterized protein (DUF4415 family)
MIKLDNEEQAILESVENGEWKSKPNLAGRKQELQRYAKYTREIENVVIEQDILTAFKSTGNGWQTRINNALKEWLREHPNFEHA